ncbi:Snaclec 1 [Holothuria leucospilota]|uniref:Snaclec 1 n=1 Tax=Holothuria leucospilota TaxID=206669 RepID=A0A9Q1H228_HOLLE|nr:Snaclec 1 [Holothuria leucospilota]
MAAFNKILFSLLVASLQQITTADVCPVTWIPWGRSCYRFEINDEQKLTWENAEDRCNHLGRRSHLASIHSAEEQEFIYEVFSLRFRSCGTPEYDNWWQPTLYIGLRVGYKSSDLSWSDGSRVDYKNWFQGEPNNFPNSAGQVSAGELTGGRWVDAARPNSYADYYVCKMSQ